MIAFDDDTSLAAPVEHFRCAPYATLLRRSACGERFVRMNRKGAAAPLLEERIRDGKCVACPVGEVHAAGARHPDAPRVPSPVIGAGAAPGRVVARTAATPDLGPLVIAKMARRSMELSAAKRERRAPTSAPTTTAPTPAPQTIEAPTMSRPAKLYAFEGKMIPLSAISAAVDIHVEVLRKRIANGWTEDEAFSTPLGETRASKLQPPPAVEQPRAEREELLEERVAAELPRDPVELEADAPLVPAPRSRERPQPRPYPKHEVAPETPIRGVESLARRGRWLELELHDGRVIAFDPIDIVGASISAPEASEFDTPESITIHLRGRESEHLADVEGRALWRIITEAAR